MKKICIVTATRAEYGLLKPLIALIASDSTLELCLLVTGTHLLPTYGNTVAEIEADGFPIAERISFPICSDTPEDISRTMGHGFMAFADAYARHKPDMVVVLGDRYELIPICFCAVNSRIPIAHISGGETTEGAVDEVVRHCVTKMSYLHFPGCEAYRQRIIQLGESPERVFNFGDIGVENAKKMPLLSKGHLAKSIGFSLDVPYFSVTFHPVTLECATAGGQMEELLSAINALPEYRFLFTKTNADAGGQEINEKIDAFVATHHNCFAVTSLGVQRYLSSLRFAEGIIGNSSSGIVEAPCFGIPTINIGDRQKGRLQADSILNCEPICDAIVNAVRTSQTVDFRTRARNTINPYGNGETAKCIVATIKKVLESGTVDLKKKFYDLC